MSIDSRWHTWIRASVNSVIEARLKAALGSNFKVIVEGEPETSNNTHQQRVEIRMDGPDFYKLPSQEYRGVVEINLLITRAINDNNIYEGSDVSGVCANALSTSIQVSRLGVAGDKSAFGCLTLSRVRTKHFGRIEPSTPLEQTSVEVNGEILMEV